ncbi:hypothetical protein MMC30_005155 [Trapelia coarctata]|nr:hypothetical protein [Trapelia coarctata]
MATGSSTTQIIDSYIEQLFAGWSIYTSLLTVVFVAYLVYPLFFGKEPDTHPLLLARQATASPTRQPGESAIYRSLEAPHGYPLRSGLNVKDPGAPKWTNGRDGDLRDVWKKALGGVDGRAGNIISVKGKETFEHKLEDLTGHVIGIGKHIQKQDAKRVAIYLPNSIEFLVAVFAAAFYGFTPILIPPKQSFEVLADILHRSHADVLIAPAGTVQVEHLAMSCPNLKHTIWVVEPSSRHMDFKAIPSTTKTAVEWHEVIRQIGSDAISSLPSAEESTTVPNFICVLRSASSTAHNTVEYTQRNIIAAVAAQISALPRNQRIEPSDLVLPLDGLSFVYPFVVTLAALYSNASLALTSVAGTDTGYDTAFQSVFPTIVITSAQSMLQFQKDKTAESIGIISKVKYALRARALSAGRLNQARTTLGPRLIYVSTDAGSESAHLTQRQLNDIRLLTGSRTVYALADANVAGAIAQTSAFDYRITEYPNALSHFGPPLSSVELKLVDTATSKISDDRDPSGLIVVSGPAVVGGERNLGVMGRIRDDNTLTLI